MKKFEVPIILFAMSNAKRFVVVLDFPKDIDDFITFAKKIYQSMNAGVAYAGSAAKLATLNTNIGKLLASHSGSKAVPPTYTVAQRDVDLNNVKNNLRSLQSDVQALVDADSTNADTLATGAGMRLKKPAEINKQDLELRVGEISGTIKAIAKGAVANRAAHDWWLSEDGGTTWIPQTPSLAANTLITGLTPSKYVHVRHRYIYAGGPTDYTVSEAFLVR